MKRPLFEFINNLNKNKTKRFFMPGHKGELNGIFKEAAPFDITEIQGADYLYEARGIIGQVEESARDIFQTGSSVISVSGSSTAIFAMLKTVFTEGDTFLCDRNCHVSAVNAVALLGLNPVWLYPAIETETSLAKPITPEQVEKGLQQSPGTKGVFLTSPNYFGQVADIAKISEVCKAYNVKLLVDNAHGALLKFLEKDNHPITLGADFCCDSLHKTLPALTGTALLHMREEKYRQTAKDAMALFSSTSPSYLMMLSVEDCLQYLQREDINRQIKDMQQQVRKMNAVAKQKGFTAIADNFALRICISANKLGYKGDKFAEILRNENIEPEYVSEDFAVLLPGFSTLPEDYTAVAEVLQSLQPQGVVNFGNPLTEKREKVLQIRAAVLGESEEIEIEKAVGRVCAQSVSICPPGIAVLLPGERIDSGALAAVKNSGFLRVKVLK